MNPVNQTISFLIFLVCQIVFIENIVLFDVAFCFIYIAPLLMLPFETNRMIGMCVGFVSGLCVDVFQDTLGVHAAACVFLMFVRPFIAHVVRPFGGYENNTYPVLHMMGFRWIASYSVLMILTHHSILFLIEASNLSLFLQILSTIIFSTILTFIVFMLVQYLFYQKTRTY